MTWVIWAVLSSKQRMWCNIIRTVYVQQVRIGHAVPKLPFSPLCAPHRTVRKPEQVLKYLFTGKRMILQT